MPHKYKIMAARDHFLEMKMPMYAHAFRANRANRAEKYKPKYERHYYCSYLSWYRTSKTKDDEKTAAQTAVSILKQHSKESKASYQIKTIYHGDSELPETDNGLFREIAEGFENSNYPKRLLETLLLLEARSKLLGNAHYIKGIVSLVDFQPQWIRDIEEWKTDSHNADRQFSSLCAHLLARFDVPKFMDKVWLCKNKQHQAWYVHIGRGRNIRTAHSLPISLSKKMAHYFVQSPASYSVPEAFRWAQIISLGGDEKISRAINETRLTRVFKDDEFWLSVFRFFIDYPMLDCSQINPIVDYIWNQKYESRIEFTAPGIARNIGPAQPNFSMRKRTPLSLLDQVAQWHRQLGRQSHGGGLQWEKSAIDGFKHIGGIRKTANMKVWYLYELLSSRELRAEGRSLSHCVASYAQSCFKGRSAIFTLDRVNNEQRQKMLTIEVNMNNKQVCQARGKHNRRPTKIEKKIIRRWADKEHLQVAHYI